MKQEQMFVISNTKIACNTYEMTLLSHYVSQTAIPGQFINILVPDHTLRRPISIASVDHYHQTVTIVYKIVGSGTRKLSTYRRGHPLDCIGPTGNGFNLQDFKESTVLLIGGGVGIPPLHFFGKSLVKKDVNIISILGFRSADEVFYKNKFNKFSQTLITTNDGSMGEKGFVTDMIKHIKHFDLYASCGPLAMLQAVTRKLSHKRGFISLEERMGCGVGACFACVIPTRRHKGYQKICQDGPVFSVEEVVI